MWNVFAQKGGFFFVGFILKIESEIAILEVSVFFCFVSRTNNDKEQGVHFYFFFVVGFAIPRTNSGKGFFCFVLFCFVGFVVKTGDRIEIAMLFGSPHARYRSMSSCKPSSTWRLFFVGLCGCRCHWL